MSKFPASTRELLEIYRIKPLKKFSQNFILSASIVNSFTKNINCFDETLFVEIGTGLGGIAKSILKRGSNNIIGIECDVRMQPLLEQLKLYSKGNFDYIIADALKDDQYELTNQVLSMSKIKPKKIVLIGNLPFQISGKLLAMWNQQCLLRKGYFETGNVEMSLIFSKEVASKLLPTHSKRTQFNAITNLAFTVREGITFSKKSFYPAPSCDAMSLDFTMRDSPFQSRLLIDIDAQELDAFNSLLKIVYTQPNKTVLAAFSRIPNGHLLVNKVEIQPNMRLFEIPIETLIQISRLFNEISISK